MAYAAKRDPESGARRFRQPLQFGSANALATMRGSGLECKPRMTRGMRNTRKMSVQSRRSKQERFDSRSIGLIDENGGRLFWIVGGATRVVRGQVTLLSVVVPAARTAVLLVALVAILAVGFYFGVTHQEPRPASSTPDGAPPSGGR